MYRTGFAEASLEGVGQRDRSKETKVEVRSNIKLKDIRIVTM